MSSGALTIYQRGIRARNALWASFFLLGFASRTIFCRCRTSQLHQGVRDQLDPSCNHGKGCQGKEQVGKGCAQDFRVGAMGLR